MISDERFEKKEHILKSKDFNKVYKKGLSYKKDAIILYCLPNGLKNNRIGFSISARNVKLAINRNRVRRLFREAYRLNKKSLKNGSDIIFIVRRYPVEPVTYDRIEEIFLKLAKYAGLLI